MLRIAEYNKITGNKIDLKELEEFGFIYDYDYYRTYENGKPIHWWNDGRDVNQYKYYRYGYDKYDLTLYVYRDRRIVVITPEYEENIDETIDLLYDLIEAGYVEKVEEE